MSVLDRDALLESPLADLHAIASELGIDGFRRLRKADLAEAIIDRQGGGDGAGGDDADAKPKRSRSRGGRSRAKADDDGDDEKPRSRGRRGSAASSDDDEGDEPRSRGRRGGAASSDDDEGDEPRSRGRRRGAGSDDDEDEKPRSRGRRGSAASSDDGEDDEPRSRGRRRGAGSDDDEDEKPRSRGRRGGAASSDDDDEPRSRGRRRGAGFDDDEDEKPRSRGRGRRGESRDDEDRDEPRGRGRGRRGERDRDEDADEVVEGTVELVANGSGFVRVSPPEPSDEDVYISAAQVRRCELVSGDRVAGPVRAPRRSERFPSLVRIDTINGKPADEVAEGTRYEDLPVAYPSDRIRLRSDDATVQAIADSAPFGKGSRMTIVGGPRSGKTEALRRLALELAGVKGLEVSVVLAGARPEEIAAWSDDDAVQPVAAVSFAASPDALTGAIEPALEQARRIAARGGDAVVLIDTLDGLAPHVARRALAAARNIVDGGSLTVIATASEALGGETTIAALDARLVAANKLPALDVGASAVIRPDILLAKSVAETLARARAKALLS